MQLLKYKDLFIQTLPGYRRFIGISFLMMMESGLSLLSPVFAGLLAENLFSETQSFSYRAIIFCWLLLLIGQFFISYLSSYLSGKTSKEMLTRLKIFLFNHIQSLPLNYFHENKHGKTLSLITYEAPALNNFFSSTIISVLPLFLTFTGALFCMLLIDPMVAFLSCLLIPLFIIVTKLFKRKLYTTATAMLREQAELLAFAEENIASLPVVKSFTREEVNSREFSRGSRRLLNHSIAYIKTNGLVTPLVRLLATSVILIILWFTAEKISSGHLSQPDIVRLLMYGMLLSQPISRLSSLYGQYQNALSAAERIARVLQEEKEPLYLGKEAPVFKGNIRFSNVHFTYPFSSPLLRGINLEIQEGETIAILGENGAGKSTLTGLLLRFYEPDKGEIFIDDTPVNSFSLNSLRRQIGLVQQQIILQNCSIRDNMLFGKSDATEEELITAARGAHALSFIQKLPAGFDTIIGDRGIKLSGGQQQRLSLARALLKDPPILILDEATAMFDPEGEIECIKNCRNLFHRATVILVTHRPASLKLADRQYILKDGKLHLKSN